MCWLIRLVELSGTKGRGNKILCTCEQITKLSISFNHTFNSPAAPKILGGAGPDFPCLKMKARRQFYSVEFQCQSRYK